MNTRGVAEVDAGKRLAQGMGAGRNAGSSVTGVASATSPCEPTIGAEFGLIEQVIERANLIRAWKRARANKGAREWMASTSKPRWS